MKISFLYELQQPTEKLCNPNFFKILQASRLKEDSLINSNAKIAIQRKTERVKRQKKKKKTYSPKRVKLEKTSQFLTA